jgi:hypothetical protein
LKRWKLGRIERRKRLLVRLRLEEMLDENRLKCIDESAEEEF